jgi:WD40 repeat protein
LFNFDNAKKHPNLKVKQIISHPGEITVIRSSPMNRRLLASKSDTNSVYLWTSDKYKAGNGNNFSNNPDITLLTTKSEKHNYALRFTPSLPRIISASGNKLELFDIDGPPAKR